MRTTARTVFAVLSITLAAAAQLPVLGDEAVVQPADPVAAPVPAQPAEPSQPAAGAPAPEQTSASPPVAADPRLEELRVLQTVLQNIHAPGKDELGDTINRDSDMQKAFQLIDKTPKLTDVQKQAQKDAYVRRWQKKSQRFNQLLAEKHIDWYESYLDSINNECHGFWSKEDYKDAESLARVLNSRAVQAVKEISQQVSDPVKVKLAMQIFQSLEPAAPGATPAAVAAANQDPQVTATKVASIKKALETVHTQINLDELVNLEELVSPDKKQAEARLQRLKQLQSAGKVNLLNMYIAANVEEFDKSWSADDYKDLEILPKLAETKVFKTLEEGGPMTEAVDHAVQKLPAILAPARAQLQAEEKAGKFDEPKAAAPPAPAH